MALFATNPPAVLRNPIGRAPLARYGVLFAWVAVLIYAASNSIVTQLVDLGEMSPVADGRNAITYSNLLLLGSLLSVVPMAIMFRKDLTRKNVRALKPRDWRVMTLSAFLSSALTPGLFFFALANTTVTNVVLISRIEPPLFLLAAYLVLHEKFSPRTMIAGLLALSGAVIMIGMSDKGGLSGLGIGEWAAAAATLSYIASTLVTRKGLRDVPMGVFSVYRTIVGAAIYFVLAITIFGPDTFRDLFSPVLWSWIWVYAGIVIVLGQMTWNLALKHASSGDLALATSFSPLAGIVIAMMLLGEDPGAGLLPGAVLIVLAILIGRQGASDDPHIVEHGHTQRRKMQVPGQPCFGSYCVGDSKAQTIGLNVTIKKRRQPDLLRLAKTAAPPGLTAQAHRLRRPSVQLS